MISKDKVVSLSDSALLGELEKLSKQENETTVHVLLRLAEVEQRKEPIGALFAVMAEKAREISTSAGGTTREMDRESDKPVEPEVEQGVERYEVRFSISREQLGQIEEVKSLLSGKYPEGVKLKPLCRIDAAPLYLCSA